MKVLALEFSSARRSVALIDDLVLVAKGATDPHIVETTDLHTTGISLIDQLLTSAKISSQEIDVIAVGLGPGSYTGIRSAIALAQGWQFARDTKILGVSSVEILAADARKEGYRGEVALIIDAQRKEVYEATYLLSDSEQRAVTPLQIVSPAAINSGATVLGPGASKLINGGIDLYPSAATLGEVVLKRSDYIPGEHLEPIYLREATFVKAAPKR
jgi:tRNA threonylcarbamoyladenosine biosynthesis protein TsaB